MRWMQDFLLPSSRLSYVIELCRLSRFHAPVGALLLFWPCAWGLLLSHNFRIFWWGFFLVGAFLARTIGVVYNDIIDHEIDRQVQRTKDRPLAQGTVSLGAAWILLGFYGLLGLGMFFLLPYPAQHIAGITAGGVLLYPFMKRWTWYPQIYLGMLFNMGLWIASSCAFTSPWGYPEFWWFYLGGALWTIWYDTIYAFQDRRDDTRLNLGSMARWIYRPYVFSGSMMVSILICWMGAGYALYVPWTYYSGFILLGVFWTTEILRWQTYDLLTSQSFFKRQGFISGFWVTLHLGGHVGW